MAIIHQADTTTNIVVNRPLANMPLAELVTQVEFEYSDGQQISFEYLSELIMRAEDGERPSVSSQR